MRNALHTIASLLMWCLFGYYWLIVSRRQINAASLEALGVLGAIVVAGLAVTLWWIAHNKKLARRNRRNTPPPTVPESFDTDFLGCPLTRPEVKDLQAAQVIIVDLETGTEGEEAPEHKVYRIATGEGA